MKIHRSQEERWQRYVLGVFFKVLNGSIRQPNDCLVWTGSQDRGYGVIRFSARYWKIHRLVWTLMFGPIPNRLFVCHKCDDRLCWEPNHLFLGTNFDNLQDAKEKGRLKRL